MSSQMLSTLLAAEDEQYTDDVRRYADRLARSQQVIEQRIRGLALLESMLSRAEARFVRDGEGAKISAEYITIVGREVHRLMTNGPRTAAAAKIGDGE